MNEAPYDQSPERGNSMEIFQRVMQAFFIVGFAGHFVGLLACELLIKQAFVDLGKPNVSGVRRREIFMRVFKDKTYCRALSAHSNIILAIAIARFLRWAVIVLVGVFLLGGALKFVFLK
jgi:hypothetical protein